MFRSQIARSANEFLLLGWLSSKPAGWPIVISVSRHTSRAHDSKWAGDSGDEPPELSRSAAGRSTCDRAIYFLARRTLLDVPLLGRVLPKLNVIPVNQEGVDRSAIKAVIRVLQAGNGVLMFPEGSRTLDGNLQSAEPGLGLIIAKTLAPVVPMRIFGAREALPRGGGRLRFVPITIVVGEPILFHAADLGLPGKNLYARLSDRVMKAISTLSLE